MILRSILTLVVFLMSICPLQGGIWENIKSVFVSEETPEPPTIKVLLEHDVPYVDLEVKGGYNLYDPYKNKRLATRFSSKGNRMEALATGLRWGEEFPGVYQIAIIPDSREIVTLINGKHYRGNIFVYDVGGSISVVNEVEIEDYLSSMLPNKFDRQVSDESLAAAAIAERTHAFHTSLTSENPYWHVNANEVGYMGVHSESVHPPTTFALASTRFMIMSKTGLYEGSVTPFPVHLVTGKNDCSKNNSAMISIDDIEIMSRQGDNAAKILSKSFPEASIEMMLAPANNSEIAQIKVHDYSGRQSR